MRLQRYAVKLGGLMMACSGGMADVIGDANLVANRVEERQSVDNGGTDNALVPDTGILDGAGSPFPAVTPIVPSIAALPSVVPSIADVGLLSGGHSSSDSQLPTPLPTTSSTFSSSSSTTVPLPDSTTEVPSSQPSTSQSPVPLPVSTFSIPFVPATQTPERASSSSTPPTTSTLSSSLSTIPTTVIPVSLTTLSSFSLPSTLFSISSSGSSSAKSIESAASSSSSLFLISTSTESLTPSAFSELPSNTTSSEISAGTLPPGSDPIAIPQQAMPPNPMRMATIAISVVSVVAGVLAIAAAVYYFTRKHLRRRVRSPESPPPTPSLDEKDFYNKERHLSGSTLQSTVVEVSSARHDGGFGVQEKEEEAMSGAGDNNLGGFNFGDSWPLSNEPVNDHTENGDHATREDMAKKVVVGRIHETVDDSTDESRSGSSLSSSGSVKSKSKGRLSLFPTDGRKRRRTMTNGDVVGLASNF